METLFLTWTYASKTRLSLAALGLKWAWRTAIHIQQAIVWMCGYKGGKWAETQGRRITAGLKIFLWYIMPFVLVEVTGGGSLCVRWRLIWLQATDADINQVSALTDYLCGGLGQRDKTGRQGGFEHKPVTVNLTTTSEPVVCFTFTLCVK